LLLGGCHSEECGSLCGHSPVMPLGAIDSQTTGFIATAPSSAALSPGANTPPSPKNMFQLPSGLPGAEAAPIIVPPLPQNRPKERDRIIQETFPPLPPLPEDTPLQLPASGKPLTLTDLQALAKEHSPTLLKAAAAVEAAQGEMIQAGLPPNPSIGYQADQVQPGPGPTHNAGQQGAYFHQLIKTAGKLHLAQAVAGIDYLNAQVASRRAQVDLATQVRTSYFALLVARENRSISRSLVQLTDEVYQLQLKQVGGGVAAAYEPLQLYVLAVQARNNFVLAENRYRAAWQQLTAALGTPDLCPQQLAGRADAGPPDFHQDLLRKQMLEVHTDVLTAQNNILQAEYSLRLAIVTVIPDLQTGFVVQHDNAAGNDQFNVQVGFDLPIWNCNQGNIRQARGQLARANAELFVRQNDLVGRLAEAFGRYDSSRVLTANFRDRILPNLGRAYRGIYQRHQQEPDKVGFNDVVVAQQNLAQALVTYLGTLGDLWTAVVDVANLVQMDELYLAPVTPEKCPELLPQK
jgi:outer membrane protein, heavy metal efflux system